MNIKNIVLNNVIIVWIFITLFFSCNKGDPFSNEIKDVNLEYIFGGEMCQKQGYIKVTDSEIKIISCDLVYDAIGDFDKEYKIDRIYAKAANYDEKEELKYLILLENKEAVFIVEYEKHAKIWLNGIFDNNYRYGGDNPRANSENYLFILEPITIVKKF